LKALYVVSLINIAHLLYPFSHDFWHLSVHFTAVCQGLDFFVKDSFICIVDVIRRAVAFNEGESDAVEGSVVKEVLKGGLIGGYLSAICCKFKLVICFFKGSKGD
jgi:hypothetical protein